MFIAKALGILMSNLEIWDFELFREKIPKFSGFWLVCADSLGIVQNLVLSSAKIHGDFELFSADIPGTSFLVSLHAEPLGILMSWGYPTQTFWNFQHLGLWMFIKQQRICWHGAQGNTRKRVWQQGPATIEINIISDNDCYDLQKSNDWLVAIMAHSFTS